MRRGGSPEGGVWVTEAQRVGPEGQLELAPVVLVGAARIVVHESTEVLPAKRVVLPRTQHELVPRVVDPGTRRQRTTCLDAQVEEADHLPERGAGSGLVDVTGPRELSEKDRFGP